MTTSPSIASFDERLDAWFRADPEALRDGPALWRDLRETSPVYRFGPTTIITSYALVKGMAQDNVSFSNDHSRRGSRAEATFASLDDPVKRAALIEIMGLESRFMNRNDAEAHRRLRGSASAAMTPRRISQVVDAISNHARTLIAELEAGGEVDLLPFTYELPLRVICDLIGVPAADRAEIRSWGVAVTSNRHGLDQDAILPAHEAWIAFRDYVRALVDRYRRSVDGSDQLVTLLMDAHGGDRLDPDETVATFLMLLLGGHETSSNLIAIGLYELLSAPGQWQALVREPSLIPYAVEELLRMVTPAQTLSRRATVDISIDGVPVAAQDTVIGILAAANRDPAVFVDPERLDVRRPDAKRHIGFGFGPHFCLGASLARAEATIALQQLVARFPNLALSGSEVYFAGPWQLRRLTSLPVALGEA